MQINILDVWRQLPYLTVVEAKEVARAMERTALETSAALVAQRPCRHQEAQVLTLTDEHVHAVCPSCQLVFRGGRYIAPPWVCHAVGEVLYGQSSVLAHFTRE